jgi:ADP-ribose pyrophosphatase YjhB (NUDIX family)
MNCRVHKLVADLTLVAEGRVALVRYRDVSRYDGQRGWFLPDDHLQHGEDPAAGTARIARDQLGLAVEPARLATVESFANGAWHLIFHYLLQLDRAPELVPGPNLVEARWFEPERLPPREDMAHDGWAADVLKEVLAGRGPAAV